MLLYETVIDGLRSRVSVQYQRFVSAYSELNSSIQSGCAAIVKDGVTSDLDLLSSRLDALESNLIEVKGAVEVFIKSKLNCLGLFQARKQAADSIVDASPVLQFYLSMLVSVQSGTWLDFVDESLQNLEDFYFTPISFPGVTYCTVKANEFRVVINSFITIVDEISRVLLVKNNQLYGLHEDLSIIEDLWANIRKTQNYLVMVLHHSDFREAASLIPSDIVNLNSDLRVSLTAVKTVSDALVDGEHLHQQQERVVRLVDIAKGYTTTQGVALSILGQTLSRLLSPNNLESDGPVYVKDKVNKIPEVIMWAKVMPSGERFLFFGGNVTIVHNGNLNYICTGDISVNAHAIHEDAGEITHQMGLADLSDISDTVRQEMASDSNKCNGR